jgi:AraC family transcriptional regulator, regulatory protein of adaptative response / DNA-3-methyladenine glycosylase II
MKWSDRGRGEVNAVRSTGIYCRAGCSARPNPANTRRLRSPVEAEAKGYRACLKCRPDRLPLVPFSQSTDEVVSRALVLIGDGFLDRHDERSLALEVAVSVRHLRRLFSTTLGATPTQVAVSRRAHFARMLLDDSDLTVTQIAYASGFGSVRRLNEVFRQVFTSTPTELRRRSVSNGRRPSLDGGLELNLLACRPLDADQWVRLVVPTLVPGVESVIDGVYRRSTNVCEHPGIVQIEILGAYDIRITAHLPAIAGLIDEIGRCRRLLALDELDVDIRQEWTPFEAAMRALFSDHDHHDPRRLLQSICNRYGRLVRGAEAFGITHEFPAPHELIAPPSDLPRTLAEQVAELAREHSRIAQ